MLHVTICYQFGKQLHAFLDVHRNPSTNDEVVAICIKFVFYAYSIHGVVNNFKMLFMPYVILYHAAAAL